MDLRERALKAYEIEMEDEHRVNIAVAKDMIPRMLGVETLIAGDDLMTEPPTPDSVWADGYWFRRIGEHLSVFMLEHDWVKVMTLAQLGSIIKHAEFLEANKQAEAEHRKRLGQLEVLPDAIKELLGMHPDLQVFRVERGE